MGVRPLAGAVAGHLGIRLKNKKYTVKIGVFLFFIVLFQGCKIPENGVAQTACGSGFNCAVGRLIGRYGDDNGRYTGRV